MKDFETMNRRLREYEAKATEIALMLRNAREALALNHDDWRNTAAIELQEAESDLEELWDALRYTVAESPSDRHSAEDGLDRREPKRLCCWHGRRFFNEAFRLNHTRKTRDDLSKEQALTCEIAEEACGFIRNLLVYGWRPETETSEALPTILWAVKAMNQTIQEDFDRTLAHK